MEGIVETVAEDGNIYASATTKIYKISTPGEVTLIAGSDTPGYKDAVGTEARFTNLRELTSYKNYLYMIDGYTIKKMAIK